MGAFISIDSSGRCKSNMSAVHRVMLTDLLVGLAPTGQSGWILALHGLAVAICGAEQKWGESSSGSAHKQGGFGLVSTVRGGKRNA